MSNGKPMRRRGVLGLAILMVVVGSLSVWALAQKTPFDFTGEHVSDFVIAHSDSSGIAWWMQNPATGAFFTRGYWGSPTCSSAMCDRPLSGDFDGDGIADLVVYRSGIGVTAGFWIVPSSTGVAYFTPFGQAGDDPSVLGDYDGDGKTDLAVYRRGTTPGSPSYWYYKRSTDGVVVLTQWGQYGDYPAPGDYDGDGKNDFAIQRDGGGGNAIFWLKQTTAGIMSMYFAGPNDIIVPGDYDGDGKTDIAVTHNTPAGLVWWIRRSSDGVVTSQYWGTASDRSVQGDYDGDGKTDVAIWRPGSTPGGSALWVSKSTGGTLVRYFGSSGDYPVAAFNSH